MAPTNGELNIMLKGLDKKVEERFGDMFKTLERIESTGKDTNDKATSTNGKIAAAQIEIAKLKATTFALKWIIGVISAAFIAAIPTMVWINKTEINNSTHNAVISALSEYNIVVK